MENNLLNAFSVNVTIISSVVAIAAVSICSILTAVITQHGTRKAKQTELIFHEMTTAYYGFIKHCDDFSRNFDLSLSDKLSDSYARSLMFASKETQELLTQYAQTLAAESVDRKQNADIKKISEEEVRRSLMVSAKLASCRKALLAAMQKDLRK